MSEMSDYLEFIKCIKDVVTCAQASKTWMWSAYEFTDILWCCGKQKTATEYKTLELSGTSFPVSVTWLSELN